MSPQTGFTRPALGRVKPVYADIQTKPYLYDLPNRLFYIYLEYWPTAQKLIILWYKKTGLDISVYRQISHSRAASQLLTVPYSRVLFDLRHIQKTSWHVI